MSLSLTPFELDCYAAGMAARKHGVTAWLIRRRFLHDHASRPDEIVAILSGRLGGDRIREFVELSHFTRNYSLAEQASMLWPRPGGLQSRARFGETQEGDPWEGEVYTWGDPYLLARRVDQLVVDRDEDGKETVTWKDRPRESSVWMHSKTEQPLDDESA
jgi:hypothetical protein